jgi:hypothetical protein
MTTTFEKEIKTKQVSVDPREKSKPKGTQIEFLVENTLKNSQNPKRITQVHCPGCNFKNPNDQGFCLNCGIAISTKYKKHT